MARRAGARDSVAIEPLYRELVSDPRIRVLAGQISALAGSATSHLLVAECGGEGRRIRRRRRVTCASALVIAAGLLTWLALPKQETQPPAVAHSIPSDAKAKPSGASHIRYLSDAELISRLREVGIGIGVAGAGDQKEILLVSRQGGVFHP